MTDIERPKYNLENFSFETSPQRLKQEILDQYEQALAKKKKDDFDKMFIQTVKQKMKQVRMKLVVTHKPSGIKKSWVIETEIDQINKENYIKEVMHLVQITRAAKRREIRTEAKVFDGARYQTIGGVFNGSVAREISESRINTIGKSCTTNNPFVAKAPRKPRINYIGVELEFNALRNQSVDTIGAALQNAKLARYIHVGEDGSCGGFDTQGNRLRGFEVRVLLEETNFEETLGKICEVIKGIGFKTDETCGTHVHLDMRNRDVKRCYANLFKTQLLLRKFLTRDRKHNVFCMKNAFPTYDEHMANATGRESRRCSINTLSYTKYKTLEVRMHQGTLDVEKLVPFIKLLTKVANYEGTLEKTIHTLKQAKDVLKVEEPLFKDLAGRLKKRGA
jgi:hypothetical protein